MLSKTEFSSEYPFPSFGHTQTTLECMEQLIICMCIRIPGEGGDSNIKMSGCLCWVSENAPILNETSSYKNIPILNGFSEQFIPKF